MTARVAKFADIPQIVDVMQDAHRLSRDAHLTTFDETEAKQLLMRCIQRHGHTNYLGTLVMVSESPVNREIRGFMIGILDQVHPCLKELKATDLFFIMQPDAPLRDARKMLLSLIDWARDNPKVIKILLGMTDDLADPEKVSRLYESVGLESCGGMYRIDFGRRVAEAS